ncbi:MAG: 50S ribosomal protein L29 [Proteobacteria bacterium]|nr:MAG: 50S ribosomal protein L29 [Pseudomonadota bacterium]
MAEKKKTKAASKSKPVKRAKAAKPKSESKSLKHAKTASAADDLRAKTESELSDQLVKLKKEQFNLRFQRANGQLEKTNRVRVVRREIARINTVLNEQRRRAAAAG